MAEYDYTKAQRLKNYIEALAASKSVVEQVAGIVQPDPIDEAAIKTMCRNQIVAGSADKAAFFGTLTTAPTVTASDLQALGMSAVAATAVIAERDRVRALALSWIA